MKILPHKEQALRNTIRDIIAVNPTVSVRDMQRLILNNLEYSIGDKYLSKLMRKVQREAIERSDRKTLNMRLAEVRERHLAHQKYIQRIIYWRHDYLREYGIQRPTQKERMSALKLSMQMEIALFKAETMLGVFEPKDNRTIEISEQVVGISRTLQIS